jgi:hypothetical protein
VVPRALHEREALLFRFLNAEVASTAAFKTPYTELKKKEAKQSRRKHRERNSAVVVNFVFYHHSLHCTDATHTVAIQIHSSNKAGQRERGHCGRVGISKRASERKRITARRQQQRLSL